jgi:hypothetical protein
MVNTRCSKIGTASGTAQNVITICNYDKYQYRDQPSGTASGTRAGQQRDSSGTNKNKGNKGNKERGCMDGKPDDVFPGSSDDAFEEFWKAYPSRSPASNPRKPALEKFRLKVRDGIPAEDILRGVDGFAAAVAQRRTREGDAFNPVTAVCQAVTFINQERWEQYTAEAETELTDEERAVLARHSGDGQGGTVLDVVSLHASKTGGH